MRILKVILTSMILSSVITLIFSLISYTPIAKRDPDTYYFSIGESFLYLLFTITPILVVLCLLCYFSYVLLGKISRFSHFLKILLSILIVATLTSITIFLANQSNKTNDIYLIPEGYEGDVFVFYNIKGAQRVESKKGYEVHRINSNGYFATSTPDIDYATVTDKYFYVDAKGNRTSISKKCVSLFGTGGYSTSEVEDVDLIYTGFRLIKDNCSDEFTNESFDMEDSKERMINEILNIYYGVEREDSI